MNRRFAEIAVLSVVAIGLVACGPSRTQGQETSVTTSAAATPVSPAVAPSSTPSRYPSPAEAIKAGLRSLGYTEGTQQVEFTLPPGQSYKGIVWTSKGSNMPMPTVILYADGKRAGQIAKVEMGGFWCSSPQELKWDFALASLWDLADLHKGKIEVGHHETVAYRDHTFVCGQQ